MLNGLIPADRFLPYLTWKQISEIKDIDNAVIILPTGSVEQHGPHLPCAVDSIVANGIVGHALSKLPDEIPAFGLPTIMYGKSDEHIHFPGTMTVTGNVLYETVIEIGESVYRSGFKKLLIVNAHGGQPQPLEMAARELRIRHADYIIIPKSAWSLPHDESFMTEEEKVLAMHAGHAETAILLSLAPELVHMDEAKRSIPERFPCPTLSAGRPAAAWCARDLTDTGVIGDPTRATTSQGAALVAELAASWARAITEVYQMKWPSKHASIGEELNEYETSEIK